MQTVRQVTILGVINENCQPKNFLVKDEGSKYKIYMIDFAQTLFREECMETDGLDEPNGWEATKLRADNSNAVALVTMSRIRRITGKTLHVKGLNPIWSSGSSK